MSILDREISFYTKITDKTPSATVKLSDVLTGDRYRQQVQRVRNIKATAPDKYTHAKQGLPAFTVSGTFTGNTAGSLVKHSGLICVDIDTKGNDDVQDFNQLKEIISAIPYVAYCGHSVGGEGYLVIIPVSNTDKHLDHFTSLEMDFGRCGLTIDKSCKDVKRLRFVSWDDSPYINPNAKIYDWILPTDSCNASVPRTTPARSIPANQTRQPEGNEDATRQRVESLIDDIKMLGYDIVPDYDSWWRAGCALATTFGESGRNYFHDISAPGDYDYTKCDQKYTECLKSNGSVNIGTLFHLAKDAGLSVVIDFKDIRP